MGGDMTTVDQLVFGYREGHQFLGGSRQLDPRDLRLLLGATDMSIDNSTGRFLTGLQLVTERDYALAATWSAPEAPRPGAVWAHLIIVPAKLLGELPDPFALTSLLARPDGLDLRRHAMKLEIPEVLPERQAPPADLLKRVVASAYASGSGSVLVEPDLELAEDAIAAVWRAQWPELRLAFTFRTRPTARIDKPTADLVITRQVRGTARPSSKVQQPRWASVIVETIAQGQQSTFGAFLREFGPQDPANVQSVRDLADVFGRIAEGSVDVVRQTLEKRYPTPQAGRALKAALFGPGSDRPWSGSEVERVQSLLASTVDAWDVNALNLPDRILGIMNAQGVTAVSEALSGASAGLNDAFIEALAQRTAPSDLGEIDRRHPDLVLRLAELRPEMLGDKAAWTELSDSTVHAILITIPLNSRGIVAAIDAGYGAEVLRSIETAKIVRAIAHDGTYANATELLASVEPNKFTLERNDDRVVFLFVALFGRAQVDSTLPDRLERCRERPDEFWLRAAVLAITSTNLSRSNVLIVAFGPLHNAITSDRLPRDCWNDLDEVLPSAPDPALRLRRYLLAIAKNEQWTGDQFERALRGAGPYAGQLLHDFSDEDDWWVAATRAVIRAAVGILGGHR
jgi:hypothetical protein